YYLCTGTIREDAPDKDAIIAGLHRAMTNYGATIGPHNGGLRNPNNPSLTHEHYDYWHWGPDEALDVTPEGYPSGKAYAFTSLSNSFIDVEQWLPGLMTNGMRTWVACYFNGSREDSYDIQEKLNIKIAGDQKLSPFPHWTVSTRTSGKRYRFSSQPPSDWFVGGLVAQSLEPWHPPGVHSTATLRDAIDYYYRLGGLINFYSHTLSHGVGAAGQLAVQYVTYSMNTNLHPRLWSANAIDVYEWSVQRSNAQVQVSFSTNGLQSRLILGVSNPAGPATAVEALLPGSVCNVEVFTNGVPTTGGFRFHGQTLKVLVGTTVTNVLITYYPMAPGAEVFRETFDGVSAPELPVGWTTAALGAQSPWVTQTTAAHSVPNAAFCPNPGATGICELVSGPISLAAGQAQLSFRNSYMLESSYDGGVLEMKIGTNAFADIVALGGVFRSGGYNSTLDTRYHNPLGGRRAWSGTTAGFTTTTIDLPPATSGQTVQFRWRCATDDSTALTGWWIDDVAVINAACLCCGTVNSAPILPVQQERIVAELSLLTVTNTAVDPDLPPNGLFYSLLQAPAGAVISASGVIQWTPGEDQGPSTNAFVTRVVDNGVPPLSATNAFQVVVTEVNTAPVLPVQTNRNVKVGTPLSVTNTASDADIPQNSLSYTLVDAPAGAAISSTGVVTWVPAEGQNQTTNLFVTIVSDGTGAANSTATNAFTVVVWGEPVIVLDTTQLVAESCLPANGVVDANEEVSMLV
ncbi:MAG TPA: hypothetical protein VN673_10160, partial [Clostridia bacterium]|nr:hypothetical protein [Clostridia bacterium]